MSDVSKIIFGFSFIFLMTTLGSLAVFLFKKDVGIKTSALINGFSAGIMLAASIWSLILPAIEQSESYGDLSFLPAAVGFLAGCGFIVLIDLLCKKIGKESDGMKKSSKIFIAMTLHNIPEGLAVGVAFGGAWALADPVLFAMAVSLAVGMGIQNIPEGAAVALPMKEATGSKLKGFLCGVSSAIVEPIAAVIGFFLAASISVIMPWVLSFAAGAMFLVILTELLPEGYEKNHNFCILGSILGFVLMMILDVALG